MTGLEIILAFQQEIAICGSKAAAERMAILLAAIQAYIDAHP